MAADDRFNVLYFHFLFWFSDNVLQMDNRVKRVANNLKFVDVELSDSGNYHCIAGQEMATLTLNVIGKS